MTIPNNMGNLDPSTYLCLTEVVEHPQLFFFHNVGLFLMRLFERVEKKLCISTQDPSTYAIEDSLTTTTTTLAIEDSNNKHFNWLDFNHIATSFFGIGRGIAWSDWLPCCIGFLWSQFLGSWKGTRELKRSNEMIYDQVPHSEIIWDVDMRRYVYFWVYFDVEMNWHEGMYSYIYCIFQNASSRCNWFFYF